MSDDHSRDIERIERRFKRERMARKEAEKLLEDRSLALYESNVELTKLATSLESKVQERTEELEAERNRALELSKAKSEFVATMSHEIRTPINGIIGALNLLEDEHPNEESQKLLEIAKHSSSVLLHIINDILDFSKIEAGQMQIETISFNLFDKVNAIVDSFREKIHSDSVSLSLNWDENVQHQVMGDPHRLTQVLNNYLSNAVKFTHQGSICLDVIREENTLRFSVTDTGVGVPADKLNRLFKDFSQVDASTTRKFGGTGLGLVITKRITEMMHGHTTVTSEEGKGSCFSAILPYQPCTQTQLKNESPDRPLFDTENTQSAYILLVDDNQINREIGQKILTHLGHQVDLADSGKASLKRLMSAQASDQMYDLILMDCQMPDMNGYQTTEIIRQQLKHIPIIALTANTADEDKQMAYDSGMNDFLSKPFAPNEIQSVIQAHLSSQSSS